MLGSKALDLETVFGVKPGRGLVAMFGVRPRRMGLTWLKTQAWVY